MPAKVADHPAARPAIAAPASPYGLRLHDDRRNLNPNQGGDICPDSPATYH
jgi:hypothetical protein